MSAGLNDNDAGVKRRAICALAHWIAGNQPVAVLEAMHVVEQLLDLTDADIEAMFMMPAPGGAQVIPFMGKVR